MKIKIEEIFTFMEEMNRGQKEKEELKARKGDEHSKVHEISHPSEPERIQKDCTKAATEEHSRRKMELDEVKKKNEMIAKEEVEKIKKKKIKKTMT